MPTDADGEQALKGESHRSIVRKSARHAGSRSRQVELVIGLDFGSGYSKCVIRDPDLGFAVAIPLADGSYIGPSNVDGSGSVKLRLVKAIQDEAQSEDLRAHEQVVRNRLAELLQTSRRWFSQTYKKRYKDAHVIWAVNLGIPVSMEEFGVSPIEASFRRALQAAWIRAFSSEQVDSDVGATQLEELGTHVDLLNVYPEVGAEVTTYIQSPEYRDGLHCIVDLGAGSVDVATFNLVDQERQAILASQLSWSGAEVLAHHANASEVLATFGRDLFEILRITKVKKIPQSSDWRRPLEVFWCGGGIALPAYRERVDLLDSQLRSQWAGWMGFNYRQPVLPSEESLHAPGLSSDQYHRLSVADGLSHRIEDMADFIGPPPDAPPRKRIEYYPPGLAPIHTLND